MRWGDYSKFRVFGLAFLLVVTAGCSSKTKEETKDRSPAKSDYGATASLDNRSMFTPSPPKKQPSELYREANVKKAYIKKGTYGRRVIRRMRPRYITIHSTQNYSPSADAWRHSQALNHGMLRARKRKGGNRIGFLTWHYTVDQYRCVQHLPCNEQGEHADFDGPGNNYSIGIEMCENRGNSRARTMDRTAKLTAWLMYKYKIPLRKVVPHYHWARKGLRVEHKNCPHFLMDHGHPGAKWQAYLAKINKYYKEITPGKYNFFASSANVPVSTVKKTTSLPVSRKVVSSPSSSPRYTTQTLPKGVTRVRSHSTSSLKPSHSTSTASKTSRKISPKSTRSSSKTRYHTVKRGDTLYGISRRYKVSVSKIQKVNGIRGSLICVGKKLRIPRS